MIPITPLLRTFPFGYLKGKALQPTTRAFILLHIMLEVNTHIHTPTYTAAYIILNIY